MTTTDLIKHLLEFPDDAPMASFTHLKINNPDATSPTAYGRIYFGNPSSVHLGTYPPQRPADDFDRIALWLRQNPTRALYIAHGAVMRLFGDGEGNMLSFDDCTFPSGADYMDCMLDAIEQAGMMPLINQLQQVAKEEAEEPEAPDPLDYVRNHESVDFKLKAFEALLSESIECMNSDEQQDFHDRLPGILASL